MGSGALVNYDEAWAQEAQRYAQDEPVTGGAFLSTRGGQLSFGDELLPGNQVCCIILDAIRENTFYANKFNPDVQQSPICYAFGRGNEEMAPHPSMQKDLDFFVPQAPECDGCAHNEWGTADTGRGKACQNRRRLALIPAGYYAPRKGSRDFDLEIFTDPDHYAKADIAYLKVPVMSVKDWAKYVSQVSSAMRRPPYGVITRLYLEPDAKSQFKVHFEALEVVPDELAAVVIARHEEAVKAIEQGYLPPREEDQPQGSIKGLRRGR